MSNEESIANEAAFWDPRKWTMVPYVGPNGEFRHTPLSKANPNATIGDVVVKQVDGVPVLSPGWAARGWVLYEDLCNGKVAGVQAEPDKWDYWVNFCKVKASGQFIAASAIKLEEFYHSEVLNRRNRQGGRRALTSTDVASTIFGKSAESKKGRKST